MIADAVDMPVLFPGTERGCCAGYIEVRGVDGRRRVLHLLSQNPPTLRPERRVHDIEWASRHRVQYREVVVARRHQVRAVLRVDIVDGVIAVADIAVARVILRGAERAP